MTPFVVEKQNREHPQSVVRRFTRRVKESGILLRARAVRFHERPLSGAAKKRKALRRIEKRREGERLSKLGLVAEKRGRRR